MTVTHLQRALTDAIHRVLAQDAEVEAAWLAGSLGAGRGDAFSDVDVLVLAAHGKVGDVASRHARNVAAIAAPALVMPLYGSRVLSVITVDWQRFDLTFIEADDLVRYDPGQLANLFDRTMRVLPARPAAVYQTPPPQLLKLVNEFLRVLGLSVVAMGREEYLLGLRGVDLLRQMTIEVMLEENDIGPLERGGALHLNPMLTAAQRGELATLAPVAASRDGVLVASMALAAMFLPRAARLGARVGMQWPEAFEQATRRHLQTNLGVVPGGTD